MLRMFVFAAGFIMIAFAIRFFKDEIMLYKNGVKNEATLILMKPYNHVDINEVRNKVYYVGIEPILEVDNDDKKVIIEYDNYDEFKDLKVGDKVKVIYPKENPEVIVIEPGKEPTKYTIDEYNELIKKEELETGKTPVNKTEEKKSIIEEIKTKSKQRRDKRAKKIKDITSEESSEE